MNVWRNEVLLPERGEDGNQKQTEHIQAFSAANAGRAFIGGAFIDGAFGLRPATMAFIRVEPSRAAATHIGHALCRKVPFTKVGWRALVLGGAADGREACAREERPPATYRAGATEGGSKRG
jgi:hypothetical protein